MEKVELYTSILKKQMDAAKNTHAQVSPAQKLSESSVRSERSTRKGKGKRSLEGTLSTPPSKRAKTGNVNKTDLDTSQDEAPAPGADELLVFKQSVLITGTKLKDYQLEGVAWMVGLYGEGISGILGKAHQCTYVCAWSRLNS
jgi:ATP-dependent DNA helicase